VAVSLLQYLQIQQCWCGNLTKKTIDYSTRTELRAGILQENSQGWRNLHTDFINNNEADGFHVTYVNGADDPGNTPPPPKRQLTKAQFEAELAAERNVELI